jgi:hypothetical protein
MDLHAPTRLSATPQPINPTNDSGWVGQLAVVAVGIGVVGQEPAAALTVSVPPSIRR